MIIVIVLLKVSIVAGSKYRLKSAFCPGLIELGMFPKLKAVKELEIELMIKGLVPVLLIVKRWPIEPLQTARLLNCVLSLTLVTDCPLLILSDLPVRLKVACANNEEVGSRKTKRIPK